MCLACLPSSLGSCESALLITLRLCRTTCFSTNGCCLEVDELYCLEVDVTTSLYFALFRYISLYHRSITIFVNNIYKQMFDESFVTSNPDIVVSMEMLDRIEALFQ